MAKRQRINRVMTVAEVAKVLHVSVDDVNDLISDGILPAAQVGAQQIVTRSDLDAALCALGSTGLRGELEAG